MHARQIIESLTLLEKDGKRGYSCVMVPIPQELADIAIAWGKANVPDEDLFVDEDGGKGREDAKEFHCTAFYGLLSKEPDEHLLAILDDTGPFEVFLGNVSLFKNEDYDVLKLDVESQGLELLNARISELPNENEFKKFVPHATIAYVQKDSCDHLVGKKVFDDAELSKSVALSGDGAAFVAESVIFSNSDSEKQTLLLGNKNAVSVSEANEYKKYDLTGIWGAWIAPNGRMHRLKEDESHQDAAENLLRELGCKYYRLDDFNELMRRGYVRVVNNNEKIYTSGLHYTRAQKAVFEKIGIVMGKPVHWDLVVVDLGRDGAYKYASKQPEILYTPPVSESEDDLFIQDILPPDYHLRDGSYWLSEDGRLEGPSSDRYLLAAEILDDEDAYDLDLRDRMYAAGWVSLRVKNSGTTHKEIAVVGNGFTLSNRQRLAIRNIGNENKAEIVFYGLEPI